MNVSLVELPPSQGPSLEAIEAELRRRNTERALKGGAKKARARCKTLAGFIREAWAILEPANPYVGGWHIELICAHLEAITFGTFIKLGLSNRLLINLPPGMMKSLLVSVLWPAWEWGPAGLAHLRYVTTSYSDTNVIRDSRKMRDLIESDWYQALWPEVVLTRRGENDFENTMRGGRQGRPFPSLTGGRGDRLLIDDPHSTESAESEADRKTAIRIFRESVPLRINNAKYSAIIIIMQRLHEHDVSGVAMALKLGYTCIILPMEFEVPTAEEIKQGKDTRFRSPLGRKWDDPRTKDGELIFPQRFPADVVERDKVPLGAYGVAGQFQQRPAPRGGLMFKRANFRVIKPEAVPADIRWVRGWDLAASETNKSPFTCGLKLGRDTMGKFYIGHVARERVANPESMIVNTATQDGQGVEIDLPQDPGAAGKIQARSLVAALAGYIAFYSPESGDKINRARPVASQSEAGNIYVVEGPWNEAFFSEIELFPNSAFKDQVDALSRAFGRFVMSPGAAVVVPVVTGTPHTHFGDNPNAG